MRPILRKLNDLDINIRFIYHKPLKINRVHEQIRQHPAQYASLLVKTMNVKNISKFQHIATTKYVIEVLVIHSGIFL